MFEKLGGVPPAIWLDNLATAVVIHMAAAKDLHRLVRAPGPLSPRRYKQIGKVNCLDSYMNTSPWINESHLKWEKLIEIASLKKYKKGSVIYTNRNHEVYLVNTGRVRVFMLSEDGEEKTLSIVAENNIFGEVSVLDEGTSQTMAETIVDCEIYAINREQFQQYVYSTPELSKNLVYSLVRKLRILSAQIEDLCFYSADIRVIRTLYNLWQSYGRYGAGAKRIQLKFTHQEMAILTGTARVTVTNVFGYLKARKIIAKSNGYYYILDETALKAIADK